MDEYYYYGLAAMLYITTCWTFAVTRWWHTCRAPKERLAYIWPDRKLQVLCYLCATVLLPYAINPTNGAAWMLMKSYFPATYYFYCGLLLLCFFGTVKQWNSWKTASWVAAIVVIIAMLPPVLNAWLPIVFISAEGMRFWQHFITIVSVTMMGFSGMAMWQVWHWLREACDANYSNPDDFPVDYAHRVWVLPVVLIPLVWPAYLLDSRALMAVEHVLLAVFNMVLLITVLPVWRRAVILASTVEEDEASHHAAAQDTAVEEQIEQTALEIRAYVEEQRAYLEPHLKIDDVVAHSQRGRSYVSLTFQRRFGSFANYVNSLRLAHYEQYVATHPDETKEAAAQASGFSSYNAYYRAKQKFNPVR